MKYSFILNNALRHLRQRRLEIVETLSQCGPNVSAASKKRVESEISRQKLEFKRREAELIRERALLQEELDKTIATAERRKTEIKVGLDIVKLECENAEVEAEMKVLDEARSERHSVVDKKEFTRQYVEKNSCAISSHSSKEDEAPSDHTCSSNKNVLNPDAQCFVPTKSMDSVSQFLPKKDLQLQRISKFPETPETYASWKANFQSIAKELILSTQEELDLLIKHLGSESSKYATSIRSYSAHDPAKGREQIWLRLDERYGRPEMVEASLKKKLHQIPKLSTKDYSKLYDLLDVLCEIESLKSDPQYSSLLAYFDFSSGVAPVVNKLPYGLQEKWTFRAAKYKQDKSVAYPPFNFFVTFICELAIYKE